LGVVCRNSTSWFEYEIHARKRVIVCCGAIESPKLLMLSGIGPAAHLNSVGVSPLIELPGVGQNLQDHVIAGVQFAGTVPVTTLQFLTESGLFASVKPAHSGDYYDMDGHPTVQFFMNTGVPDRGFPWAPDDYFGIFPSLTRPETTGTVTLTARDPRRPPTIQIDYLSQGSDMDILINAVRLAVAFGQTKALQPLNGGVLPIPTLSGLQPLDGNTPRKTIAEYLLLTARGLWHPACTCAMGPDAAAGAVVDDALNVHGVEALSVCDASIFPAMTCGNPNATVIAVAEKFVADLSAAGG
jgi:choline dehydrogenase